MPSDAAFGRQAELLRIQAFLEDVSRGRGRPGNHRDRRHWQDHPMARRCPSGASHGLSGAELPDLRHLRRVSPSAVWLTCLQPVSADVFESLPTCNAKHLRSRSSEARQDRRARMAASSLRPYCRSARSGRTGTPAVAVDDAQSLDAATVEALSFAVRRLDDVPLRILVSVRNDGTGRPRSNRSLPIDRGATSCSGQCRRPRCTTSSRASSGAH